MQRLPPQRGLQPIGEMSRYLAPNVYRLLADCRIEAQRAFDRLGPSLLTADHLDQRHQMRGVERLADNTAFGVSAPICKRLIRSPDELDAMTVFGSSTASS